MEDMAKSPNPVSITANPNIEQNRDTTFSKISQNFLAQSMQLRVGQNGYQ